MWCLSLVSSIPGEVFFSGDGGLKALMVKQLLRGEWSAALSLGEPAWVRALWDEGMYPFRTPFVHALDARRYASFEWAFPALSAPGYAIAGWRGLYWLPVLGVLGTWVALGSLLHRMRVGGLGSAVAIALLIFATPLTFYAAAFWEHTLAVGVAFAGYADLLLLETHANRTRATRAGVLLGLAGWLRPEALVLGAAALAVHAVSRRWREAAIACASFGAVVAAYFVFNRLLYGEWLGVHAIEVVERASTLSERLDHALERAGAFRDLWLDTIPFTWMALLVAGVSLASKRTRGKAARRTALVLVLAFCGTALIAPNAGGMQIGPRYLLPLMPLMMLLVALGLGQLACSRSKLPLAAALIGLALLAVPAARENLGARTSRIEASYATRIFPSVAAIGRHPEAGVLFGHHFAALEMSSVMAERPAVTVSGHRQVERAIQAMVAHGHDVLLVDGPSERRYRFEGRHRHGERWIEWTTLSERGSYTVLLGRAVR